LLRAAGSDAVLARYRAELGSAVARTIDGQDEHDLWQSLCDFPQLLRERHPQSLLISMTLPLTDVQPVLEELDTVAHSHGLTSAAIGRVGVGHLLLALWPSATSGLPSPPLVKALAGLRSALPRGVNMTLLSYPEEMFGECNAWAATPTDMNSMRAVKQALDPNDILNRGRFAL
jgi:FAD/FMN-containing dehydrogenase